MTLSFIFGCETELSVVGEFQKQARGIGDKNHVVVEEQSALPDVFEDMDRRKGPAHDDELQLRKVDSHLSKCRGQELDVCCSIARVSSQKIRLPDRRDRKSGAFV